MNDATPAGAGVANQVASVRSGADPEDLATAVRASSLCRRLAILHRDPLGVLDLDLLLVLDAVSLGHCLSLQVTNGAGPRPLVSGTVQASVPDGDESFVALPLGPAAGRYQQLSVCVQRPSSLAPRHVLGSSRAAGRDSRSTI